MYALRPLGNMNYLRIWHDNSGRGSYASWFLSSLVVRDVQTNEVFEFICNKWMAQEKDDNEVWYIYDKKQFSP